MNKCHATSHKSQQHKNRQVVVEVVKRKMLIDFFHSQAFTQVKGLAGMDVVHSASRHIPSSFLLVIVIPCELRSLNSFPLPSISLEFSNISRKHRKPNYLLVGRWNISSIQGFTTNGCWFGSTVQKMPLSITMQ